MRKIISIQVLPKWRLKLTYATGREIEVNFESKIEKGTATEPLLDEDFFKRVKIAFGGRALEWPGELDFCADALWFEGSGEVNPFAESEKAS